jgi:hypothetical protein
MITTAMIVSYIFGGASAVFLAFSFLTESKDGSFFKWLAFCLLILWGFFTYFVSTTG